MQDNTLTLIGSKDESLQKTAEINLADATGEDSFLLQDNVGGAILEIKSDKEAIFSGKLIFGDAIIEEENKVHNPVYLSGQAGLDDLGSSGLYTQSGNAVFQIKIEGTGTPDNFEWRKGTSGAWTGPVAITGSAQLLQDGISVTWGATTGHDNKDEWEINVGHEVHISEPLHVLGSLTVDDDLVVAGDIRSLSPVKIAGGLSLVCEAIIETNVATMDFVIGGSTRFVIEDDGTLSVNTPNYEDLVIADDVIPNKKYVDDAVDDAFGSLITLECLFIEDQADVSLTNNQIVPFATSPSVLTGGTFSSNRYTIGQDGRFEVISMLSVVNTSAQSDDTFYLQIRKNTTVVAQQTVDPMAYAGDEEEAQIVVMGIFDFVEEDVIDVYITGINDVQNYTSRQLTIKQLPSTVGIVMAVTPLVESTGLIGGGAVSVNSGDNTLVDISAGSGQVVDSTTNPLNPLLTPVSWAIKTGYNLTTTADPGDLVAIYLALDSGGLVVERLALPTPEERRNTIDLGIVARNDADQIVFAGSGPTNIIHNPSSQLQDLMAAWGPFNIVGNRIQPNAADLQIKKTEGTVFRNGVNFQIDGKNPHMIVLAEQAPVSPFNYKLGDGTDIAFASQIDPDSYDDGTSTLATVPNRKWTVQYISVFASGVVEVLYGQEIFSNEEDAIIAISNIDFVIPSDSQEAIPLAFLVLQQGDTSLTADRFYRISRGGTGGGSVSYWNRAGTELSPANIGDSAILATQTELANYPNFSADPGWTFSGSNTWTYDGTNDRMRPVGEVAGDTITDTGISLTSGKTYVVSLSWFKFIGTGSLQIYQGSAGTQKSDYIDEGTYSARKWMFVASANENLFIRSTGNFHSDTTVNYINKLSVIEIDSAGDTVCGRLALGGLSPEYYSQIDSYDDTALFFPPDKSVLTVSGFEIRNINSGGLDFDETYARIMLASYDTSVVFGSNGYATASLRGDENILLRTTLAGGVITLNENLLDTDYVVNGDGVEAYKYDAGNATHTYNGNVAIADYTKLGSDAPAIKTKKLTGTTAATEGGNTSVAHGVTASKILSVILLIEFNTSQFLHVESTRIAGYQAHFQIDSVNINVYNHATNSENILSKPFRLLVIYEE